MPKVGRYARYARGFIFIKIKTIKLVGRAARAAINLVFQISLHEKDINLLEQFKLYFGVGGISKHGSASLKYSVRSHKDMQKIIAGAPF
jgi:hypothetical protein